MGNWQQLMWADDVILCATWKKMTVIVAFEGPLSLPEPLFAITLLCATQLLRCSLFLIPLSHVWSSLRLSVWHSLAQFLLWHVCPLHVLVDLSKVEVRQTLWHSQESYSWRRTFALTKLFWIILQPLHGLTWSKTWPGEREHWQVPQKEPSHAPRHK